MGFYDDRVLPRLMNVVMGTSFVRAEREKALAGVTGDVLEVGFGSGHTVEYRPLGGERIDAPDGSFDSVVSTFTLCTIPDPGAALSQMRRVLKPGGLSSAS